MFIVSCGTRLVGSYYGDGLACVAVPGKLIFCGYVLSHMGNFEFVWSLTLFVHSQSLLHASQYELPLQRLNEIKRAPFPFFHSIFPWLWFGLTSSLARLCKRYCLLEGKIRTLTWRQVQHCLLCETWRGALTGHLAPGVANWLRTLTVASKLTFPLPLISSELWYPGSWLYLGSYLLPCAPGCAFPQLFFLFQRISFATFFRSTLKILVRWWPPFYFPFNKKKYTSMPYIWMQYICKYVK